MVEGLKALKKGLEEPDFTVLFHTCNNIAMVSRGQFQHWPGPCRLVEHLTGGQSSLNPSAINAPSAGVKTCSAVDFGICFSPCQLKAEVEGGQVHSCGTCLGPQHAPGYRGFGTSCSSGRCWLKEALEVLLLFYGAWG